MVSVTDEVASVFDFTFPYAIALLACIFLVSSGVKMIEREQFVASLQQLDMLPKKAVLPVSRILPLAELSIVLSLVLGERWSVLVGAGASLVLLLLFNAVAGVAIRRSKSDIECACFGPLSQDIFDARLIARNSLLSTVALFAISVLIMSPNVNSMIFARSDIVFILLPVCAAFPLYTLSIYFLSHREYYQRPPDFRLISPEALVRGERQEG